MPGGRPNATMAVQNVRVIGSRKSGAPKPASTDGIKIGCHDGSGITNKNEITMVTSNTNPLIMEFTPTAPIQYPGERVKIRPHVGHASRIFHQ